MKFLLTKVFIVVLSILLVVTPTMAEVIYLKDGTKLTGEIEQVANGQVLIYVSTATVGSSYRRVYISDIDYVLVNDWAKISPDSLVRIFRTSLGSHLPLKDIYGQRPGMAPEVPLPKTPKWAYRPKEKQLDNEFQQEYNRSKLSIELEGVSVVSYSYELGLSLYSHWRKWTAFKGLTPLSEDQFFHLTGYDYEAYQAKKHRGNARTMTLVGGVISVVGLAMTYSGYSRTERVSLGYYNGAHLGYLEQPAPDWGLISLGTIVSAAGFGMFLWGLLRLKKNWAPYSAVRGIADDYNEKLLNRLLLDQPR